MGVGEGVLTLVAIRSCLYNLRLRCVSRLLYNLRMLFAAELRIVEVIFELCSGFCARGASVKHRVACERERGGSPTFCEVVQLRMEWSVL